MVPIMCENRNDTKLTNTKSTKEDDERSKREDFMLSDEYDSASPIKKSEFLTALCLRELLNL